MIDTEINGTSGTTSMFHSGGKKRRTVKRKLKKSKSKVNLKKTKAKGKKTKSKGKKKCKGIFCFF